MYVYIRWNSEFTFRMHKCNTSLVMHKKKRTNNVEYTRVRQHEKNAHRLIRKYTFLIKKRKKEEKEEFVQSFEQIHSVQKKEKHLFLFLTMHTKKKKKRQFRFLRTILREKYCKYRKDE